MGKKKKLLKIAADLRELDGDNEDILAACSIIDNAAEGLEDDEGDDSTPGGDPPPNPPGTGS